MSINPATTYYVRVKAINTSGESSYSNIIAVTTLDSTDSAFGITPLAPSAPVVNNVLKYPASFQCRVDLPFANEYIKEIKLDVSVNADYSAPLYSNLTYKIGTNTQYYIDGDDSYLSFNVGGLTANTLYYCRIRFSNTIGLSGYATFNVSMPKNLTPPDALGTLNLTAIAARVTWGKVVGASTYFVDVAEDVAFSSLVANNINAGDVAFRDITALVELNDYFYRIRASDGVNTSDNSNVVKFTTLDDIETYDDRYYDLTTPAFSPIKNLNLTTCLLNWRKVDGATQYRIDVSLLADFSSTVFNNLLTTNNYYELTGLVASTVYFARIRAFNPAFTTPYGTSQTFTTIGLNTLLNPPQILTPSLITSNSILFQWVTRSYATRYLFEVSTVSNFASTLYSWYVTGSSILLDTNLNPATQYYVRMRGLNTTEASNYATIVSGTTAATPPAITVSPVTNLTSYTAQINWVINAAYSSYSVSVYETGSNTYLGENFFNEKVLGYVSSLLVDVFLKPNTAYSYVIKGVTASGDSRTASVGTFTTKSAGALLQLSGKTIVWTGAADTVDISEDSTFKFKRPGYPRTVTDTGSFDISNILAEKRNYYIRVYLGTGDVSNTVSTFSTNPYPITPEIGKTTTLVKWKKNLSENYEIQVKADAGGGNYVPITGHTFPKYVGNTDEYALSGLTANLNYSIQVRYQKSDGTYSALSFPTIWKTNLYATANEPPLIAGAAPTLTQTSVSFDRVTVALSGYSLYQIEIARDSDFELIESYWETAVASNTYFLKEGRTYYMRASGLVGTDKITTPSTTLTVTTPVFPAYSAALNTTPAINSVNIIDENQAEISFTPIAGAIGYTIEVSTVNTFVLLSTVTLTQTDDNKFLISNLSGTLVYYVRMYGYNDNSITSYSATQTIDTTP